MDKRIRIREIKREGRHALRRNFAACLIACLMLVVFVEGPVSISEQVHSTVDTMKMISAAAPDTPLAEFADGIVGAYSGFQQDTSLGSSSSAGVLSGAYLASLSSSGPFDAALNTLNSSLLGGKVSQIVLSIISGVLQIAFYLGVGALLTYSTSRLFLESRLYPRTPLSRTLFMLRVRRVRKSVGTFALQMLLLALWTLTIVGLPLKYYDYYLVPFVRAENPDIGIRAALKTSKALMRGHRWRTFLFDLSFIGWQLLGFVTFGLVRYLWLEPWRLACQAELYAQLRAWAKSGGLEAAEGLCDDLLFATPSSLPDGVPVATSGQQQPAGIAAPTAAAGNTGPLVYPGPLPNGLTESGPHLPVQNACRRYSIINLMLMFFLFSFIGWLWECGIALVQTGELVNRGTLYGPWIPIYGCGGALIVFIFCRVADKPIVCFFASMALSGVIEYTAATLLEVLRGTAYWDYSGFFLNIQGKVCLEGLIAFALLGMMGLYLVAPVVDALLEQLPLALRQRLGMFLALGFVGDLTYSSVFPHVGENITVELPPPDRPEMLVAREDLIC
ncbi:MAG: DUF975 family protein [Coriobacteriales bacterium]|jgi:hypothetical protein|nr:DUF975 family protein [Coriobacteriales bacterium]